MGRISSLSFAFKSLRALQSDYDTVLDRVSTAPGKPSENPTVSAWQHPAAAFPPAPLPSSVDVLIIGSGISALAVCYSLLHSNPNPPRIAVFDARGICSGGTGRNGGHIKETPYLEWEGLVKRWGKDRAREVLKFRMQHLEWIIELAEREGLTEEAEARIVESCDVWHELTAWKEAKRKFEAWIKAWPEERARWTVVEGEDARKRFGLPSAVGVIVGPAGALAPYALITRLFSILISRHPTLTLHPDTPIATIQGTPLLPHGKPSLPLKPYSVFANTHPITATHVVHCTNGYTSRLLPGLKGKIVPVRGQMTSQYPLDRGNVRIPLPGGFERSWALFWEKGFDYLTIRPDGCVMLGGGWARGANDGLDAIGLADDSANGVFESAYLRGLMGAVWVGIDGTEVEETWTGVLGMSVDGLPWVGEVPEKVAGGRRRGVGKEWMVAGFSGEGMVNAWGSGCAVGQEIRAAIEKQDGAQTTRLDGGNTYLKDLALPAVMRVTSERVKKSTAEMLVEDFM